MNTTTGVSQPLPPLAWPGTYRLVNRNSGKALEITGSSTANAVPAVQMPVSSAAGQLWTVQNLGGGEFRIDNVNSGKALEIGGSARTIGAPAQQWPWNGGFNQKWNLTACGGGYYRLTNVNTLGKIIEVANASTTDGATIGIGEYSAGLHEMWSLVPTATLTAQVPAQPASVFSAYPNPLADQGTFAVLLPRASTVEIALYQAATGSLARTLTYGPLIPGQHELTWDASGLPPGLYLYRAVLDGRQQIGKIAVAGQ